MFLLLTTFLIMNASLIIFDFNKESNISNWVVVDDVVMGGKSNGNFKLNSNGNGVFFGEVSIANNGGFSSVRYQLKQIKVSQFKTIKLRVKGDGKKYQFRLKPSIYNKFAFTTYFQTSGVWQTIEIKLANLKPTYRGKRLNLGNDSLQYLEEIGFLFGNKQEEPFQLIIDTITIE